MPMSKKTLITSRDPKGRRMVDLIEVAINKAKLDDECAQHVIERGGEFQEGVTALIRQLSITDEFADEEVESGFGYLSGYKPRSVVHQMITLKTIFSSIGSFHANAAVKELLAGAEGLFLIPRWRRIASTYGQAVEIVLDELNKARKGKFYNYRVGELGPNCFRQTAKKRKMFQKLGDEQIGHGVLVVPAQFGLRHRGRSMRRARAVMGGSECGLGAFEVGIMLLTHPDRLADIDDLWIECAGDEYAPESDGDFCDAPRFNFSDGFLRFDTGEINDPSGGSGTPSAFFSAVPSK